MLTPRAHIMLLAILVFAVLGMTSAAAPLSQRQGTSQITVTDRERCEQASARADAGLADARVFVETSQERSGKESWREHAVADIDGEEYDVAYVWTSPSGGLFVRTEQSSDSGDWYLSVDYCFRPSGTLALRSIDYRDLPGNLKALLTSEYDASGREIRHSSEYSRLHQREPEEAPMSPFAPRKWNFGPPVEREARPGGASTTGITFDDMSRELLGKVLRVYRRTTDLPFYKLLMSKK